MNAAAIVYPKIQIVIGQAEVVEVNVRNYLTHAPNSEARDLSKTPLANLTSNADPRIPQTLAEFDALYPDARFDDE